MKKRFLFGTLGVGLLCVLGLLLAQFPSSDLDFQVDATSAPSGVQGQPPTGPSGVPPPKTGNCANVGVDYPDNPYRGWPIRFYEGAWKTIAAWWCDPLYVIDFGADHWGVDIAAWFETYPDGSTFYDSPVGAEVVCTLPEDGYGYVISAREDGSWNFGMGNHVKIMGLTCEEVCGDKPPNSELEPGEVVFVEERHASQCAQDPAPPAPGETPLPPGPPEDLLLWCHETKWVATYMHLLSISVEYGELVERGQVLGKVDSTGNSSGHHLHYQINGPGVGAIDPAPAMCSSYTEEIRITPRWQRPICGDQAAASAVGEATTP